MDCPPKSTFFENPKRFYTFWYALPTSDRLLVFLSHHESQYSSSRPISISDLLTASVGAARATNPPSGEAGYGMPSKPRSPERGSGGCDCFTR
jgi:hypothetical protein